MFAVRVQYRFRSMLVFSLILATSCTVAPAQALPEKSLQTPPETTITSNAELVLVPVVVRKGTDHVSGLTQADFTIFDGGRRQKLAFVQITETGVSLKHVEGENVFSNQIDTAGETPRLTVVVVDSANIPFADQPQVRESFRKFLARDAAARGPTAVVSFQRSGVRVVQDFTSDPNVLAAITDYGSGPKKQSAASGDVSDPGLVKQANAKQQPILGILPRDTYDLLHGDSALDPEAKNFQLRDLVELELRGLGMLAQSLAGVPGRKTLIWLTGNFPFDLDNPNSYLSPYAYNQYQVVRPHGGSGRDGIAATPTTQAFQVPSTSLMGTSDLQVLRPLYEQTMKSLAQAKVAVYPIDTRGVISYYGLADLPSADYGNALGRISTAAFSDATIHSSMQTFARNTGGKACFGTNDASGCLQQAISDNQTYYLLGYYRERGDNKDGWRKLKVDIKLDGVEVLAPDGYFYSTKTLDSKEAQIRDVRSALISPVDFSGLPFTVRLMPPARANSGSLRDLKFELTIPPASLSADPSGGKRMNLAIVCVANASKGAPVDKLSETFEGTLKPETMDRLRKEGISYKNVLHLPAGQFTLRFVLRDNLNGKLGSIVLPYRVD